MIRNMNDSVIILLILFLVSCLDHSDKYTSRSKEAIVSESVFTNREHNKKIKIEWGPNSKVNPIDLVNLFQDSQSTKLNVNQARVSELYRSEDSRIITKCYYVHDRSYYVAESDSFGVLLVIYGDVHNSWIELKSSSLINLSRLNSLKSRLKSELDGFRAPKPLNSNLVN